MSDTPDNTLHTDELTAQVDELLEEIDRQAVAVEARMGDEVGLSTEVQGIVADTGVSEPVADEPVAKPEARAVDRVEVPDGERAAVEREALVGQLLEEGETLAPAVEEDVPAVDAETDPVDPVTDLDADVEALLQAAEGESAAAEAEAPATELDDDLEALIESVSEDVPAVEAEITEVAVVEKEVTEVEPAEALESAPSVEELDEELAGEAEDAIEHQLEGEIETVDLGAVIEQEALGDDSDVPEPAAAVVAEPVAEVAPAVESVRKAVAAPAVDSKAKNAVGSVVHLVESAFLAMSRPVAGLSPKQRDTIGWVALNVLFIAVCVWLVVLMR